MDANSIIEELSQAILASGAPFTNIGTAHGYWYGWLHNISCDVRVRAVLQGERYHFRPTGKWCLTLEVQGRKRRSFVTRKAGDKPNIAGVVSTMLRLAAEVAEEQKAKRLAKEEARQLLYVDLAVTEPINNAVKDNRISAHAPSTGTYQLTVNVTAENALRVALAIEQLLAEEVSDG